MNSKKKQSIRVNHTVKSILAYTMLLVLFLVPLASQSSTSDEAEPYSKDEFPTWAHDVRRAEIITIGALPFATLTATLGYSLVRYAAYGFDFGYVPNPFAKEGAGSLNQTEQIGVFAAAGGLSIGIGLTDLIIHIVKRKKKRLQDEKANMGPVIITPLDDEHTRDDKMLDATRHSYPPPALSPDDDEASEVGE